ncbi:OprD family porin [Pseudomonas sp. NMI542_15]|uniref:OprD family porin n=1 Tax=Pseudomonas sp. NMI542_15 TaxID=2903148 RepID=UPI003FA6DF34
MPQRLFSPSVAVFCCVTACATHAQADFLGDSHASLDLRNMYMDRDFRQHGATQSRAAEWGQGFWLRYESGFTEGPIGFGVDALGEVGLRLDSSQAKHGTGMFPSDSNGEPADEFSKLGLTAKIKAGKSVLRLGSLQPLLPVVSYNDVRLLPSTFEGALLTSQDIDKLTLNVGRIKEQNLRDSSGNDDIGYQNEKSGALNLAGGTYSVTDSLKLSYYYAQMEDIYKQNFVGAVHDIALGDGYALRTDLRWFDSNNTGASKLSSASRVDNGNIDNRFFNGMITLSKGGHKFGVGYQNLSGDGDFPFPGHDPYSYNLSMVNIFTKADTDAWQVRYDYNFAALGIPGLTFMTKYVDGKNVRTTRVDNGVERERDSDITYVVQNGPFKDVSLKLRNAILRSGNGLTNDVNETRVVIGYTIKLW